ncbi:NAD(P)/FAD-dependent oxidoreductase [Sulfitobacter aestuariivivens]|uniref:FAD-binding oxidoreductase n=1 Tax=Sulfitobacter aestuariivivens TaxID=2766981 RepID=A0A927D308_9RHOB|nr:FAD-binding oxidoreductase [Sulfitobacter aestuariivivens]MBD3664069.1 FAD-binding oxidoreductase [Sulfitobacter aestuariivivens]
MIEFIVIGGGIAGISAAARLSQDASVILLEREDALGYHASGRSAALFEENYGLPSTVALNKASAAYHFEANGGYTSARGLLIAAREDERDVFEHDLSTMGLARISAGEACDLVPILDPALVSQAAYHAAAYDLDTDRMIHDFRRVVTGNQGQVVTQAEVSDVRRVTGGWQIKTATETYEAKRLVNAAGAWADQIAVLAGIRRIGLQPLRRSMARIPAPGGHDVSAWPMFFGVGESWYAKPDAGALLVSPADEDPVEPHDAWADDMVLAEGLARYEAMVTTPVDRLLSSWAGLRSFAPDRALVLGPDPAMPEFIWCAAQGGYGFQTAPAASQLVADLAFGRSPQIAPEVVAQLRPERLR